MKILHAVVVATSFALGSLSTQCAAPARAPTAVAAEPSCVACAPPPRPPSVAASASARIAAAQKMRPLVEMRFKSGNATLLEYLATSEIEIRAFRDSGVTGDALVAAATKHRDDMRRALEIQRLRHPHSVDDEDLVRAEYAVAEAEFWVEEAK